MRKNIFLLLLTGFIVASCGNAKKDKSAELTDKKQDLVKLKDEQKTIAKKILDLEADIAKLDTSAAKNANAKLVSITPLTTQRFVHYIDLQGKVEADNSSFVSPRLGPGLVKAVYVKEGQNVRKGQLLLKLDDAMDRQAVAAASSQIATLEVQLASARDIYNRRQNLWKQGIGAEVQVIDARNTVKTLETNLATARQGVRMAQEKWKGSNIYADVSGVAEIVNIRPGETFTGFIGNLPQLAIVNRSTLKVSVQVPENYAGKVRVGAPVEIRIPDINKNYPTLKITRSGQNIDPSTRTFTAEASIPGDPLIRPNQIAQIRIQDYEVANTIAIPVNTVQSDDKGKYVFVSVKDAERLLARRKYIIVGELNGSMIEVKSGLQPGDQLITDGYQNLYEGQVIALAVK